MGADRLGGPPRVDVEVVADRTSGARVDEGFLRMRRLVLRNRYPDGTVSEDYPYDVVEREAMDAVAIVLAAGGRESPAVCLRTSIRPPLAFRREYAVPVGDGDAPPVLWEVPAGLVEPDEVGAEGLRACAARETLEEVGFRLAPDAFAPLGPAAGLSPGVLGEKIHFLVAEVEPDERGAPVEDGSPVEERAEIRFVPLPEALRALADGRIADVKTEVAVRRLAERSRWRAGP